MGKTIDVKEIDIMAFCLATNNLDINLSVINCEMQLLESEFPGVVNV